MQYFDIGKTSVSVKKFGSELHIYVDKAKKLLEIAYAFKKSIPKYTTSKPAVEGKKYEVEFTIFLNIPPIKINHFTHKKKLN
jgi:hypothetical protein